MPCELYCDQCKLLSQVRCCTAISIVKAVLVFNWTLFSFGSDSWNKLGIYFTTDCSDLVGVESFGNIVALGVYWYSTSSFALDHRHREFVVRILEQLREGLVHLRSNFVLRAQLILRKLMCYFLDVCLYISGLGIKY